MRLAWFTPFSRRSSIGEYSKMASETLNNFCTVDLWINERENLLETELKTFYYNIGEDLTKKFKTYDFAIYNIGENINIDHLFCGVSTKVKGIFILHKYPGFHTFTKVMEGSWGIITHSKDIAKKVSNEFPGPVRLVSLPNNQTKYGSEFVEFIDSVNSSKPILNLIEKVSLELALMGVVNSMKVVDAVAKEIYEIAKDKY